MMPLFRKEFRAAPWGAPVVVAVFLILSAQFVRFDTVYFWTGIAFAGGLTLFLPWLEWLLDGDRLLASLPVRRADLVRARYVIAVAAVGVALVVWWAWGRLLLPLVDPDRAMSSLWATVEGRLTFVCCAGLTLAVFLPFHFALGLTRGGTAFTAVAVGVALAGLLLTGAPGNPATGLESLITGLRARWGLLLTLAAVTAAIGTALVGSAWLATRAYERREL